MSRHPKTEVAAINIRIPVEKDRDYVSLISQLAELRLGVKVYGDSYVAISFFDPDTGLGAFSKYTEIDIDGDWFDLEDFELAAPEKIDEIFIPENLRPNHAAFYFKLDAGLHVLTFEKYSDSKSLSTRSVEKYFGEVLSGTEIVQNYGIVEADIVKSYGEVERILALPNLKEIRLLIRRPNPDDVSGSLAKVIEDRLREQNGEEYEEVLKSKDDGLLPNDRTKSLAQVAAENGQVKAKSIVNGVLTEHDTSEAPLTEVLKYDPEAETTLGVFHALSARLMAIIRGKREELGE
jgi:hypothetical protein